MTEAELAASNGGRAFAYGSFSVGKWHVIAEHRLRDAKEIFIYMHRNFRVSRNIRAHWLFDHLNKTVRIEEESAAEVGSNCQKFR